ncbi:hypothetical protein FHP25_00355 [Vineibacter terrae]|uniref:Uncharacterized protein n=1 Tax=Vineibacter terrae TaxID=2586908 RepID=A0A5C8PWF5_9HYPH|nr:hypothetical protein [Vineibacter terrae]TXL82189.1 hypothetical protein FHP25_00355 [Vineibacter terrae]
MATAVASPRAHGADTLYAALEDRILQRDQVGASRIYYDLVRAGRPLNELLAQAVRIHAPYTHVPYHERIDDGYVNFVNNDHCLLSARATLNLARMLPAPLAGLPMAQTIWYIPTGLDIWNQKIVKAPGHYARGFQQPPGPPPAPVVYWPDQEPLAIDGSLGERLGHWMTLVHRGHVIEAYRVFLGLMQDPAQRRDVLAELVFAGLIDVQDRAFQNRSYTTGHKSFRARSTVELGDAIGWENARDIVYAGALDIAVGPRWYSTYEMACNAVTVYLEGQALHAVPYSGTTARERAMLASTTPLDADEAAGLIDAVLNQPEPAYIERISALLLAGKGPRQILDVLQIGAAQVLVRTQDDINFSIPQHCAEYCSTLGWFYDTFQHKQRLKLLYVAASFLNRNAWHQRHTGDMQPAAVRAPAGAAKMAAGEVLDRIDAAILALDGPQAVGWTQAYLDSGADRAPLITRLALVASRIGNDPHNQEIAQCLLDDHRRNQAPGRDWLLLACAQHTARHRKYGDFLEAGRRFGEGLGLAGLQ